MNARIKALDGVRGLAILLVVVSHSALEVLPFGGPVGVTLFFVLSGFLITRVITTALDDERFRLLDFFERRARRLLPALLLVVAMSLLIALLSGTLVDWWDETWPVLFYAANFRVMDQGFAAMGSLGHLWSLSVEEHFYLLWPLILMVTPKQHRLRWLMVLVVIAAGWRGLHLATNSDWNRVYLGSDTNAFSLILGGLLSVDDRLRISNGRVKLLAVAGVVAVAALPYGYLASAVLSFAGVVMCGLLVIAAAGGYDPLEKGFLCWLGTISYGLYLWHGLVLERLQNGLIAVTISITIAGLSYRFVERRWLAARSNGQAPVLSGLVIATDDLSQPATATS